MKMYTLFGSAVIVAILAPNAIALAEEEDATAPETATVEYEDEIITPDVEEAPFYDSRARQLCSEENNREDRRNCMRRIRNLEEKIQERKGPNKRLRPPRILRRDILQDTPEEATLQQELQKCRKANTQTSDRNECIRNLARKAKARSPFQKNIEARELLKERVEEYKKNRAETMEALKNRREELRAKRAEARKNRRGTIQEEDAPGLERQSPYNNSILRRRSGYRQTEFRLRFRR